MAEQESLTYERALELLDEKLRLLEDGDISLEQALATVEEARRYLLVCNQKLEEAKRRIEVRPEAAPVAREES